MGDDDALVDSEAMPEDVRAHCLGPWVTHDDGRLCGYHNRLAMWTFGNSLRCLRCLRDHEPEAKP